MCKLVLQGSHTLNAQQSCRASVGRENGDGLCSDPRRCRGSLVGGWEWVMMMLRLTCGPGLLASSRALHLGAVRGSAPVRWSAGTAAARWRGTTSQGRRRAALTSLLLAMPFSSHCVGAVQSCPPSPDGRGLAAIPATPTARVLLCQSTCLALVGVLGVVL